MSLRLKINLIVGLLTLGFLVSVIALQFLSLRASVYEEVIAANRVAAQLLNRTALRYAAQGTPAMLAFLQGVGRVRSTDMTLYDASGQELYNSPPSPYKAGMHAPAWFERLISPPVPEQAIEFPDGRLVMRSNASRAALDAWEDMVNLALASVGLLVLVNVLVFWLVGRTVRPFGRIVRALNRLEGGDFSVALPKLPGSEAATLGAAFNRMVSVLRENIEAERRALHAEKQLSDSRELSRWIDHHIEQERRMIARELHDELGQSVTAMRSMALSIAQRLHGREPQAEQAARLIADESSRLYDAMHGLIPRLMPLVLDNFGLEEALRDLAERTQRSQPDVRIELSVDLGDAILSSDAALGLYRAAQEGITNALRHGKAQHLRLTVAAHDSTVAAHDSTVAAHDSTVELVLVDDGEGLAPDWSHRQGHYGVRWLIERIESLGGTLEIGDADAPGGPGLNAGRVGDGAPRRRGVKLRVTVPMERAMAPDEKAIDA